MEIVIPSLGDIEDVEVIEKAAAALRPEEPELAGEVEAIAARLRTEM